MRTLVTRGAAALLTLALLVTAAEAAFPDLAQWGGWGGSPKIRITSAGHIKAGTTNQCDLGDSTHYFRNGYVSNLTASNQTFTSPNVSGSLNVTGNATIGGATNSTGTLTGNAAVFNSTVNATGTTTLNALVGNSTINSTGLATLDNCTVNGSINATANVSVGQIFAFTRTVVNASNTTLSGNTSYVAVVNMSGNHTLTLPAASASGAGAVIYVVDEGGKIASTGNLTVNVTSAGNINGADVFNVNNVTFQQARFFSNGSNWFGTTGGKATAN